MKRYSIIPCSNGKLKAVDGYVIGILPYDESEFALFFPSSEEDASIINALLEIGSLEEDKIDLKNENIKKHAKIINVYQTMLTGWESGNIFLSGMIIDHEVSNGEEVLFCNLCLSNVYDGTIQNFSKTSFISGITIAALAGLDILVTEEVISKLMPSQKQNPPEDPSKNKNSKKQFPVDKKISNIAKKIISGKLK